MVTYEFLLSQFRARRGLYILGAGASAGAVQFGSAFLNGPALDYVRNARGFPVLRPSQSDLTRRIISSASNIPIADVFPERGARPGAVDDRNDFPYQDVLLRLPDFYSRLFIKYELAKARYCWNDCVNYYIFRLFYPSVVLTFNLDGLASDLCRSVHKVIDAHGTVATGYGSDEIAKLLERVREVDLDIEQDHLLMSVPERYDDLRLERGLNTLNNFSPYFAAFIGYSFGRTTNGFDDHISLDFFRHHFHCFKGNIYIIDPDPYLIREMIADGIKSNNVISVRAHWNVLANVFYRAVHDGLGRKSIQYMCEKTLDSFGDKVTFRIPGR